jgi:repressor LexA
MNNIGHLIYNRRKELGLTLEEVGKAVGVSKSTVKKWENGFIANMRRDRIEKLARALQISPIQLLGIEAAQNPPPETDSDQVNVSAVYHDSIRMVPVFESVSAGFGARADEQVIDYCPFLIASESEAEETIAIRVTGDSMSPKIEDGDIIRVHCQDSVDSGSIAVVLLDGEEGLVKRVEYGRDWIELISINPYYPPRRFEGEEVLRIRVVGLVKGVFRAI